MLQENFTHDFLQVNFSHTIVAAKGVCCEVLNLRCAVMCRGLRGKASLSRHNVSRFTSTRLGTDLFKPIVDSGKSILVSWPNSR